VQRGCILVRKILNITSWVLVGIVAVLAVLLFGLKLFGFEVYTIISGSMEPTHPVGSVIYVQKVDARTLEKGDVITYKVAGEVVTHRIYEVVIDPENPEHIQFRTKGDANKDPDQSGDAGLIQPNNVIGKVAFGIPVLGYIAVFMQTSAGKFAAISLVCIAIALMIIPDILFPKKKEQKTDDKKEETEEENEDNKEVKSNE